MRGLFIRGLGWIAATLLLSVGGRADELEDLRAFEAGNLAFRDATSPEGYLEAAARYESILARGVESGVVLFNLGNAYVRAGEHGRAIAAYRRAARLRPRDALLESNLSFALSEVGAREAEPRWYDHVLFWRSWLSYSEKASVVVGFAIATFLLGLLCLFTGSVWTRRVAWLGLVGTTLLMVSLAVDQFEYDTTDHGVVIGDEIIARKGDSDGYAPAFTEPLREGEEFAVIGRSGEWVRIRLGHGLDGWVPSRSVVTY